MKFSFQLFSFTVFFTSCYAIKCDFRYLSSDENYPEDIIDSLVQKPFETNSSVNNSKEFLCDDDHESRSMNGTSFLDFFATRFAETTTSKKPSPMDDDDADAESLCCTTTKTIHPKALPSIKNNQLVTVVNHGQFSQSVTIEECTDANKPCQFDENFPLGYITKCKQKHQMHIVKALNRARNAIIDETVYYPSGCDCKIYPIKRKIKT